jgi:DNA repair protein RadC
VECFGEVQLVYKRKTKKKMSELPQIACPEESFALLCGNWPLERLDLREEMKILLLNRANRVIGYYIAGTGSVSSIGVDIALIVTAALKVRASAIIVAHNHVSGSLKPSRNDKLVTQKIKTACSYFDITLLDHLIITSEGYTSMGEAGLL